MECKNRRVINIRTPVVLYEAACNTDTPSRTFYDAKYGDITVVPKKLKPISNEINLKQKKTSKSFASIHKAKINLNEPGLIEKKFTMIKGTQYKLRAEHVNKNVAVIKPNQYKLSPHKESRSIMNTYQQILERIANRVNILKNIKMKEAQIGRKYSGDLRENSGSPVVFKKRGLSVFSVPHSNKDISTRIESFHAMSRFFK